MLHFFRKHQKIFFFFVFIVIVVTFVFYGAYQVILSPTFSGRKSDETAFIDLNGKKVYSSHITHLVHFLNRESFLPGRKFADYNFLNEGVISEEFLRRGIAQQILASFAGQIEPELDAKCEHEKAYRPYAHPFSPLLSAETIWSFCAPLISENLAALKENHDFSSRVKLFLAQRDFPPSLLAQVIHYQEKNSSKLGYDSKLSPEQLALFGYKDLKEWFGEAFMQATAEVIIQTAAVARKEGYTLSRDEMYADILSKSDKAFQAMRGHIQLPIENGEELFKIYLRENGWDELSFLKIWEDITLFKRLIGEVSHGIVGDTLAWDAFYEYANEGVTLELVQMPPEWRFHTYEDLVNGETYFEIVGEKRENIWELPSAYARIEEIEKRAPELIGRTYTLEVAEIKKEALQGKVTTKEMWQWQCGAGWEKIQKSFPLLTLKEGIPFDILEGVTVSDRRLIDQYSREQIVDAHPEWIQEALKNTKSQEKEICVRARGGAPFAGIRSSSDFMVALDSHDDLEAYTQDQKYYYTIKVKARSADKEILSFKKAVEEKVLPEIAQRIEGEKLAQKVIEELASRLNLSKELTPHETRIQSIPHRFDHLMMAEGAESPFAKVEKKEMGLTRAAPTFISIEEALKQERGSLSTIKVDPTEGAYCYRILEKRADSTIPFEKLAASQEFLAQEASCHFIHGILKKMRAC